MDKIDNALDQLIGCKTDEEEQRAAENLADIIRIEKQALTLTVYDVTTNNPVPLNSLGDDNVKSIYVEISVDSKAPDTQHRWMPLDTRNIFILLRE
ncbi:hypothetical protein sS8_5085 [Methylocaldum marinum]|uniref:Uncharacterized protein n=1 Tax=Methylocaldum marinum TaxID=1432792 RepID=A0A250KZA1_9GAMM|nr:hypothetical protein [Methylocaldum marinum]BBA37008.1 hypothetical protein sS8_5085 [Methylocaldum marinum]